MASVVEPEPPFLAGAVKKGPAPALQLKLKLGQSDPMYKEKN